ncbi:DUF6528 family protein [Kitasatospora aureofaciens]|uniref:DUF6528 family protein n=1 Tax=Kitasatospora aureofaciens TaxID=1894 RepID=UPI000525234A|nr:DUF6528 family protein [Kitasatospora aureofaciens]HJD81585.1 DUF6528 family protein [Kitasatospora aureofaciens]
MLRRTLSALGLALLLCAPAGRAEAGSPGWQAGSSGWRVVVADQSSRRVFVLLGGRELMAYQGPDRLPVVWSWSADRAADVADLSPARSWSNPDEAKSRILRGRRYLLTTAGGGLAAVVDTATGRTRWAADLGPRANPHSIELLPDGNVAVVASSGWVRVYAASQGPRATAYTEFGLPGAHGVALDGRSGLLWALGGGALVALRVGGTPAAPTLTAVRTVPLPDGGGHDLSPVRAAPGRFWLSTLRGLWQYDPAADRFTPVRLADPAAERDVKSIGDEPGTGRLLTVAPDHKAPCDWCTSVIRLHRPEGVRILRGTLLYKARWWGAR